MTTLPGGGDATIKLGFPQRKIRQGVSLQILQNPSENENFKNRQQNHDGQGNGAGDGGTSEMLSSSCVVRAPRLAGEETSEPYQFPNISQSSWVNKIWFPRRKICWPRGVPWRFCRIRWITKFSKIDSKMAGKTTVRPQYLQRLRIWERTGTDRSWKDETRNGHRNTNPNPECLPQISFQKTHLKTNINWPYLGFRFEFPWPFWVSSFSTTSVSKNSSWQSRCFCLWLRPCRCPGIFAVDFMKVACSPDGFWRIRRRPPWESLGTVTVGFKA